MAVSVLLFSLAGALIVFGGMTAGRLLRPRLVNKTKSDPYECGEVAVGPARVQFDLRFYIVALVYLVFAVEVALFFPWAVAYGAAGDDDAAFKFRMTALIDVLVFFSLLVVGFAYLWRTGYLDWVRSTLRQQVHEQDLTARPSPPVESSLPD